MQHIKYFSLQKGKYMLEFSTHTEAQNKDILKLCYWIPI